MKQQYLKERLELLEIGELMGYPRLGYGKMPNGAKRAIRAGQGQWEKFCKHGHSTVVPTALRIARILRNAGVVPYNPRVLEATASSVTIAIADPDDFPADNIEPKVTPEAMVKPRRSSAAERQKRYRERKKNG